MSPWSLRSPTTRIRTTWSLDDGVLRYDIEHDGRTVVLPSSVLLIADAAEKPIDDWEHVATAEPAGAADRRTLHLRSAAGGHALRVDVIATDGGIAYRAVLEGESSRWEEVSTIALPPESTLFAQRSEGHYWRMPPELLDVQHPDLDSRGSDHPLLCELASGDVLCITETDIRGPRSLLESRGADTIGWAAIREPQSYRGSADHDRDAADRGSWKVFAVASSARELLDAPDLVAAVSAAPAAGDWSWVRPGLAFREMTLTTRGGRASIDFAVRMGMQYVLLDAGWYGDECTSTDATRVDVDPARKRADWDALDLPAVIDYGRQHGIGIILYVNQLALEDAENGFPVLFPLFARWGVAGVKCGFVKSGTPGWNAWLRELVQCAADHRLVVDIHDDFRGNGLTREFPNLLTVEGMRGGEHNPTATHSTLLPVTRFLGGPHDFTVRYDQPKLRTTRAHQLAQPIAFVSPLTTLFWYDDPAKFADGHPELELWRHLPTVWDESVALACAIGSYAVLARRSGTDWYLAALNNEQARRIEIEVPPLEAGTRFTLTLWTDDRTPVDDPPATGLVPRALEVAAGDRIVLDLAPGGGAAGRFVPATRA